MICNQCDEQYEPYGQKRPICRPCKRVYDREYHAKRSEEVRAAKLAKQAIRKDEASQFVYDYFKANPCVECGESRVACLQFDHLSDKTYNVSSMGGYSIPTIVKEIQKCRVLCANCHAVHTASQFDWYARIKK